MTLFINKLQASLLTIRDKLWALLVDGDVFSVQNCFELYIPNNRGQPIKACKTEADGRVVEGNHMVYRISAPTPEEKDEWIHSIKWVSLTSVQTFISLGQMFA